MLVRAVEQLGSVKYKNTHICDSFQCQLLNPQVLIISVPSKQFPYAGNLILWRYKDIW
jgi:hypothetical protein